MSEGDLIEAESVHIGRKGQDVEGECGCPECQREI